MPNASEQSAQTDSIARVLLIYTASLAAAVLLLACLVLLASPASAQEGEARVPLKPGEAMDESDTRASMVDLALAHHLATRYTSLVAADRSPTRALHTLLKSTAMPTPLPEGWNENAFGELPQGATRSRFHLLVGALMLLLATIMLLRQRHALPRKR